MDPTEFKELGRALEGLSAALSELPREYQSAILDEAFTDGARFLAQRAKRPSHYYAEYEKRSRAPSKRTGASRLSIRALGLRHGRRQRRPNGSWRYIRGNQPRVVYGGTHRGKNLAYTRVIESGRKTGTHARGSGSRGYIRTTGALKPQRILGRAVEKWAVATARVVAQTAERALRGEGGAVLRRRIERHIRRSQARERAIIRGLRRRGAL